MSVGRFGLVRHWLFAVAVVSTALHGYGLGVSEDIIDSSTGPIVLGEWNKNFSSGLSMADSKNIPMVVFYGGVSCGVCETLQRACLTDEFTSWQAKKKVIMIFTTDTTRGNARKFSIPEDGSEVGFPYIAAYWNRFGTAPAKHTEYYMCFRGKDGIMPAKGGTLASQLIRSLEMVFGAYPYDGGDFLLSATNDVARLEVEAGYPAGTRVNVPLTRSATAAYVNRLVCGSETNVVSWANGETGVREVSVTIPDGCAAGTVIPLALLRDDGDLAATSSVAVVAPQANSLRNPAWLGEGFAAGEWTMDIDAALRRAKDGEFKNVLVFFTGAMWCPHCQGLEAGVLRTDSFLGWCRDNDIALVELDNPRRSSSAVAEDYEIREASGAPPTLLRYASGNNSYAGRQESGASYLSRKGIAIGSATTPGTAEFVLQRNRRLGYAWGEGTYCAPGAGRNSYPTFVLLNADGSVAGRFNRHEVDGYACDFDENMSRFVDLLKLSGGAGESANYATTTTRTLTVGGESASAELQVNDSVEYFRLSGLSAASCSFAATGGNAVNPLVVSVVRLVDGVETVVAAGTNSVTCAFSGSGEYLLKLAAFSGAREQSYGGNTTFTSVVSTSLVLTPTESASTFVPAGRTAKLSVRKGVKYRLQGCAKPDASAMRDVGAAALGGRYYVAEDTREIALEPLDAKIVYQIWNPGLAAFDETSLTAFTFKGSAGFSVTRSGGSSGPLAVKVSVIGGNAENGKRYVWDDETVFSWADGESGTRQATISLRDDPAEMSNQTFVLGLSAAGGTEAEAVDAGALTVTLCSTDKPVLPQAEYTVPLFTTLDAAAALEAQTVFNAKGGEKVKVKCVDGKLPSGVKLVCADGAVMLSGSAKKPGTYECTFVLQQKQGAETVVGPETKLTLVVAAASDVSAGGNALLGKKIKATLPLFAEEAGGVRALKGTLDISLSAKNKIAAKYCGLSGKKISIKGGWATMADGLVESGVLSGRTGQTLRIVLDAAGRIAAELDDPAAGLKLSSGEPLKVGVGSYASAFVGTYTASLIEMSADDPAGDGYIVLKSLSANGKAKWSGALANGQSVSGSAFVTIDGDGNAVLPLLKRASKDYLAAAVRIRPNGKSLYFPRAMKTCANTVARWAHVANPATAHDCEIRGSYYDRDGVLDECCYTQFFKTNLLLSAKLDGFASATRGAVKTAASGEVRVHPSSLELLEKSSDLKMSFNKRTGVFKGTMKISFERGYVKGKFTGVVLPGWHDCGCEGPPDPADPFGIDVSQPFARGAVWFSDTLNGAAATRGAVVTIDEYEED